jgi:hypothetical protein
MRKKIKNFYGLGIALAVVLGLSLSLISQTVFADYPSKIPCDSSAHQSTDTYTKCSTCTSDEGTGYNAGECRP